MKYLVRFDKENNKYIDMVTANEEYIHKYYEIEQLEQLEEKQGYYIKTYYDNMEDKVTQMYVEIPKTKEELLEEEMIKLKKAIAENVVEPKLDELETIPDLSELDNLDTL